MDANNEVLNILDDKEMEENISISDCRKLRKITHVLTMAPLIKKKELTKLMVIYNQILDRLEKEGEE